MNVLLANIGNRDVAVDVGDPARPHWLFADDKGKAELLRWIEARYGWKPATESAGARDIGAFLLEKMDGGDDDLRFRIRIPILQPIIEQVGRDVSKVVLCCTDQREEVPAAHRSRDTVTMAQVAGELLAERLDDGHGQGEMQIVVCPIADRPHELEPAYQQIALALDEELPEEPSQAYMSPRGGIPAMNQALFWYGLERFNTRLRVLEVPEPPADAVRRGRYGTPVPSDLWPFLRTGWLREFRQYLERYDYAGAREHVERLSQNGAHGRVPVTDVVEILRWLETLMNDNVEGAEERWNESVQRIANFTFPEILKPHAESKHRILATLTHRAWVAALCYERADYLGFVVRAAAVVEIAQRLALSCDDRVDDQSILFEGRYPERQLTRLQEQGIRIDEGRLHRSCDGYQINRSLLYRMLQALGAGNHRAVIDMGRSLRGLCALRNESVHWVRGLSQTDVDEVLRTRPPETPLQLFKRLVNEAVNHLGNLVGYSPSPSLNKIEQAHHGVHDRLLSVWER